MTTLCNSSDLARSLALAADNGRRPAIQAGIDNLTRGFRVLADEGVPRDTLLDLIGGTLDALSNLNYELDRQLDEARLWTDPLDRAELSALHAKISARRS